MALPPTIPASFVPRPQSAAPRKLKSDFTGALGFFAYAVVGIVVVLAIGVFFYGQILNSSQAAKDQELAKAESDIDTEAVASFIRLRDRLSSSQELLNKHIALSGFFSALEKLIPSTVRLTDLHISVGDDGKASVEGSGIARSFNALAVASSAFSHDGRIKDAIFSNIVVRERDNSVSFDLAAMIDPKLISFSPIPLTSSENATVSASSTPL